LGVRAVLFDYGNVLVRWDPRNLYRKIFSDRAEMERFLAEICTLDWHRRHDAGASMTETTTELAQRHPEWAAWILAWDQRFGEMVDGEIDGMGALVDELGAAGVRLAMLTNMPADKADDCFKPFTRLGAFDPIIVSGLEKMAKPDPEIYELALARMNARAGDVLFVDDSPRNVATARRLGMRGHIFVDTPTLRSALADEGLPG
jgi:2-haloacid dehalogenase/putative hydrolase of the HAD superfamily